jgi:pimeloyl-ACP methyl ester carboxylesterase
VLEISEDRWRPGREYAGEFVTSSASIGEVTLQYTDWNPQGTRVLLLIHGINVQGHTWDPIASIFAAEYRVLCPDLRGHGGSSWAASGYRTQAFADDLAGLLGQLGISRCDIVGHSLGARVAIALTATSPGTVGHLVLSDSGPEMLTGGIQRATRMAGERNARRGFNNYDEALAFYNEAHPEWQPVFRELHARYQLRENWAGKLVERADPDLYWVTRSAGARDNPYLWECARRIEAPVLLLWGAKSQYFDVDMVAKYRANFPNFTDIVIDTGHYVPRERPDQFCRHVAGFLAR